MNATNCPQTAHDPVWIPKQQCWQVDFVAAATPMIEGMRVQKQDALATLGDQAKGVFEADCAKAYLFEK